MDIDEETGLSLKHKQAPITYEGEEVFSVDDKLQSLIQFFVDKGVETFNVPSSTSTPTTAGLFCLNI